MTVRETWYAIFSPLIRRHTQPRHAHFSINFPPPAPGRAAPPRSATRIEVAPTGGPITHALLIAHADRRSYSQLSLVDNRPTGKCCPPLSLQATRQRRADASARTSANDAGGSHHAQSSKHLDPSSQPTDGVSLQRGWLSTPSCAVKTRESCFSTGHHAAFVVHPHPRRRDEYLAETHVG